MCHEYWMMRRRREAEESREVWLDFERTTPISDPGPVGEPQDPAPVEAREEVMSGER